MKKIITGSLITAILSNNFAYADKNLKDTSENIVISDKAIGKDKEDGVKKEEVAENQENVTNTEEVLSQPILEEEITSIDTTQSTAINTTPVEVSDFNKLKEALNNTNNKVISITGDITFTEKLTIPANNTNVTINGNGNKFLLNDYQVDIKGEGTKLYDIKFENYKNQAISVYNTINVTLDKLELIGDKTKSRAGIDIGASIGKTSSVTVSNITSKNHQLCGIRVKNGSSINLKGGNNHINDGEDIQVILEGSQMDDVTKDGINNESHQYVDPKIIDYTDKKYVYYTCNNNIDVSNFQQLKEAITSKRGTINIKKSIDLIEGLEIPVSVSNLTINGEGNKIISKGNKSNLTIKGKHIELNNIKFEGYTSQAISVYNAKDVILDKIELIGDKTISNTGIDIGGGSNATLSNVTSKNHKLCGIRIKQGSKVKFKGGNIHINDTQDLEVINEADKINDITDENHQYVDPKTNANDSNKIYYTSYNKIDVYNFEQLKEAITSKRGIINLKENIDLKEDLTIEPKVSDITINGAKVPNITINGEGNTIISKDISNNNQSNVTKSKLIIKGKNIKLNDIKFEEYTNQAISVYNAEDVTLNKIELLGDKTKSSAGIDIGGKPNGSSVILSNITSKNHKLCGIRVKDGSKVEFKGGNIHINDTQDLEVINEADKINDITDENHQYVDPKTNANDSNKIYYTSYNKIDVYNFEQLKEAITSKRGIINLKENIDLKEDITIESKVSDITINGAKVPNIAINGDGKSIISKDINNNDPSKVTKSKITIRGKNIELNGIKFEDYTNQAISVYNAEDVTLNNIELLGTQGQSSAGIDIGGNTDNGSSVILSNITSKNHKLCGIRIKQGSTVTFKGGNTHTNDKQDIEVIDEENIKNVLIDIDKQYIKLNEKVDEPNKKAYIYYGIQTKISVKDLKELKEALQVQNSIITLTENITLDADLDITKGNITINGEGKKIISNGSKLTIKGNNIELNDIKFENYTDQAILVYATNDVYLKNIELIGDGVNSKVGIDIGGSDAKGSTNITLENITSKNNTDCGIRVRNGSSVEVKGGNTHEKDKQDIYLVDEENKKNELIDKNKQYDKLSEKVNESTKKTYIYYSVHTTKKVNDIQTLKEALEVQNSTITLSADITLDEDLDITKSNITIDGNGYTIKPGNKSKSTDSKETYRLTIKAPNTTIEDLNFEGYISNALTVYNANNVTLSNLTFTGKNTQLSNEERSKVAIDIYNSTVKLENITSKNNLYRGIQVRNGSTVEVLSKNTHENDSIHMQTIQSEGEPKSTIKDTNGYYISGTEKENNNKITVDYYSKKDIDINTATEFINNLQNSGNVLHIKKNIVFKESDIETLTKTLIESDTEISNEEKELVVSPNVTIIGYGNTIDLNDLVTITLKGNDIRLENITIKNSKDIGVNIYNSRDVYLEKVNVEDSERYGILVNGSRVKLKNCSTSNNNEGGIMITRSRTLRGNSYIDSYVEVIDSIRHDESNINVSVRNLEMIDDKYFQDNKFIAPDNIYNEYKNDEEYKDLSDYYLDLFKIEGEARKQKYKEQTTDYMVIQKVINVKENTEVLDSNGNPIRLVGDGIVDETENIEKLIEYAASHGRELYFPEGTYKITRDIDLSQINLPALSNFTITGDKNNLAVIDGSSVTDRMLKLKNEEYKSQMNYVNINNIVFNNIGIEFNGPYKKGISLNNNAFMNGKYTRELDGSGNVRKATMEPYVIAKNTKYSIENNIFLRSKNYPGRGISTYRTKNTTIKNNFFGDLEGINDASRMLPNDVISKLNLIKNSSNDLGLSGPQGNFFTAINNERYDENVEIYNNYFNMEKARNISSDFGENVLIAGINVAKEGQRRDHIIYSKSYDGLNIYGNYFKGMETGAAGGVKIRNGKNAYIGSNYFDDVPLLTYIYGDLTREDSILYNTTIYNNLFHCKTNFGGEGTGILYYQSFRDGDNLEFKVKDSDGNTTLDKWDNAFGDVKNFVIYKNEFLSDDRDQISISGRAKTAYNNKQFLAYGNKYLETKDTVNYNKGNLILSESEESEVSSKLNAGYDKYKSVNIPLTPATVDYTYINKLINEVNVFYEDVKNKGLIGILGGQYSEAVANELKSLIEETQNLINSKSLNQYNTNKKLTLIEETFNKFKSSINTKGDAPTITGSSIVTINQGDSFDFMDGITIVDDRDTIDQMNIKIEQGNFDSHIPGQYTIKYIIQDRDGNVTEFEREVVVRPIKVEINNAPTIEANDKIIKVGTDFNPLSGVTAFDAEDGDITNKINIVSNNVNTSKVGNYEVVYEVTNSKGVSTTKVMSVVVVSNNKPVIIGADDIKIKKGSKFNLMYGVSAYDYEDGDLTHKITVLGTVDTNKPGSYGIVYSVSDSENNITKITRKVIVYDDKSDLTQNPQTGDQSNTMFWVATGAIALMGIALLNRKKKIN